MSRKHKLVCIWMAVMIVTVSCFGSGDDLSDEEKLQTAVAQTIEAKEGEEDDGDEDQIPTITTSPSDTPEDPPEDPDPCNHAKFISETVEDGTDFDPNENFTKTWRLKNDGTCTWNTNYKLVFVDGDQMSGPSNKNLTQSVAPGEQVDITVDLKAPGSEGTYKGFWKVADDEGQYFVHNIWVEIEVINPAAPPPTKADLDITEFTLLPAIPVADTSMHTRVKVKNQGGTDAGSFKVEWYGLETFTNPSCDWNVGAGLQVGDTIQLDCDFIFVSWYPINKTTIVYADVDDTVDESNEGNNSASISPFGVTP